MIKFPEILEKSYIRFYSFEHLKQVFGVPFLFVACIFFFLNASYCL